jgi:steroid delta-isomerase-like uncharacterized protein
MESLEINSLSKWRFIVYICSAFLLSFISCAHLKEDKKPNAKVARIYIEEVVNKRKLDLFPTVFSPDYVFHEMDGTDRQSIKDSSLLPFLKYLFKAFPDLHYTVDYTTCEKDMVSLNLTATGTHKDEFFGYPASGKKIMFKEMFFFRIADDKIVEGWGVVDIDGIKRQIAQQD